MRHLVDTSISLFFGLMMLQTFAAGCTARVQVGDDSGSGDQEVGSHGAAGGVESSAGSGGADGGVSSTSVSSVAVGSGGFISTSGSSVAVGAGGGGSAPTAGAIAFFRSETPGEQPNDSGSSASVGGGPGTDPYDLFFAIGVPVSSCAELSSGPRCGDWQLGISIPPALQVPGIIDLSAPELWSYYVASSPDSGGGCWSGEGDFVSGTLEIVSIDAAEVVLRLSGTDTLHFNANGEHTAARCR